MLHLAVKKNLVMFAAVNTMLAVVAIHNINLAVDRNLVLHIAVVVNPVMFAG